jgi:hypothetical protein
MCHSLSLVLSQAPLAVFRARYVIEVKRNFADEIINSYNRPADDYSNLAV